MKCVECRYFLANRCHNVERVKAARKGRALSVQVHPEQSACPLWAPAQPRKAGEWACARCAAWERGWCVERKLKRSGWEDGCALWRPKAKATGAA